MTPELKICFTAARDALRGVLEIPRVAKYVSRHLKAIRALTLLDAELARGEATGECPTCKKKLYGREGCTRGVTRFCSHQCAFPENEPYAPPVIALDGTALGPVIPEAELPERVMGFYFRLKSEDWPTWRGPIKDSALPTPGYLYARPLSTSEPGSEVKPCPAFSQNALGSNAPGAVPPGSPAQAGTPRTDAMMMSGRAHFMSLDLARTLEAENAALGKKVAQYRADFENANHANEAMRQQNAALVGALEEEKRKRDYAELHLGYLAKFMKLDGMTWCYLISETIPEIQRLRQALDASKGGK